MTAEDGANPYSAEDRFWERVDKKGQIPAHRPDLGPCWLWTTWLNPKGYGRFNLNGRQRCAHVISWEMTNGPVQPGLELDHLCRVRNCVNPCHLEPVTHAENVRRGRCGYNKEKLHCPKGHPYSGENIYVYPSGWRSCRVCKRASAARIRMRDRAVNHRDPRPNLGGGE